MLKEIKMELAGLSLTGGFTYIAPPKNTAGWWGGGSPGKTNVVRITFATDTATSSVRGPLSAGRYLLAAASNFTDGWFGDGQYPNTSTVQRITYATDTNTASVRGPLSGARYRLSATGNTTDGWFGGGISPSPYGPVSTVDRITYATDTATASVRGPLSLARNGLAAVGNSDYGWYGGGYPVTSRVDRITFATDTDTASVRGPLSVARRLLTAVGNTTDGWFGGGYSPAYYPNSTLSLVD